MDKKLTSEEIDKVILYHSQGVPTEEIARLFNKSIWAIRRIIIQENYFYFKIKTNTGSSQSSFLTDKAWKLVTGGGILALLHLNIKLIIPIVGLIWIATDFFIGHMWLTKGLAERETTVTNRYNRQISEIYNKVRNIKEKK